MIAVFEVEFDADAMFDDFTLNEMHNGDWVKAMKWLYGEEDMGIFIKEPKLIDVRESDL